MSASLRLILGDQLTASLPIIEEADQSRDVFLLAEVREEATYVKHHKLKIAFLFSAMRHFAEQLTSDGFKVVYCRYDDSENQGSLLQQVKHTLSENSELSEVMVTEPGEYRLQQSMYQWEYQLGFPVTVLEDPRFFSTPEDFTQWAKGRKQLRMEFFYREMRKRYHVLMDGDAPVGGKWNYDAQNREPMPASEQVPAPCTFNPDPITRDVIELVEQHFPDHFGDTKNFYFAVTREQALEVLDTFINERLPTFGKYQDAMVEGKPWLYHSHISFYINCGLLMPKEVIERAQNAYYNDGAPLNSAEGFIRQVLGWREFVRGFYWHFMPQLKSENFFNHHRKLPAFFWTGETNMNCLRQCIKETRDNAYAHHIQRLMVLGNFCQLTGLSPQEVQEWYLLVYADAYEWVELPNVAGMVLFADGGNLASKPYISSGSYINKMSDYCKNCGYKVTKKVGDDACPFNYLYWRFIDEHEDKLRSNHRMAMMYRTYDKMTQEKLDATRTSAAIFLQKLSKDEEV
ncbi:cryptochrome/photolyase family protein [Alteromonas sp. ASW11-19]|uniref:Cryptochrome/photolyase family protein n=1 Tax=Alteromonas salexigens TaxID=2982530 RepID=A0ABT2VMQ4_9ALTE|nr:cryptochrome/photolyase family protein [Alteromonas salexigens]MCU7554153.1 cryptochrome/photolyase family protein [Alteromonas salexigens]